MAYGFIGIFLGFMEPIFPYTFDLAFGPLLGIGSLLTGARITVIVVSVCLSGILSLLYYLFMDIKAYQDLQEERKEINKKVKEAQKNDNMDEANKHMKKMMGMQKEFFKHMMKPMIVSMLVFFLFLPWMYTTFNPIVSANKAGAQNYEGKFDFNGKTVPFEIENGTEPVVIVDGENYTQRERFKTGDLPWKVKNIDAGDKKGKLKISAEIVPLPFSAPLIGDELGWLGVYILISIPLTYLFRKMLGIQ